MFIGLIILLIVLAVIFLPRRYKKEEDNTALEILKTRLAKGEINTEEFEQLKGKIK